MNFGFPRFKASIKPYVQHFIGIHLDLDCDTKRFCGATILQPNLRWA